MFEFGSLGNSDSVLRDCQSQACSINAINTYCTLQKEINYLLNDSPSLVVIGWVAMNNIYGQSVRKRNLSMTDLGHYFFD